MGVAPTVAHSILQSVSLIRVYNTRSLVEAAMRSFHLLLPKFSFGNSIPTAQQYSQIVVNLNVHWPKFCFTKALFDGMTG